jgi:hypothetical protein
VRAGRCIAVRGVAIRATAMKFKTTVLPRASAVTAITIAALTTTTRATMTTERRTVNCPECHELCGWCAWYRKNARDAGCGLGVPSGHGYRTRRRCEWGEQAKGVPCGTCNGSGIVQATITYERVGEAQSADSTPPKEQPGKSS